MIAAKRFSRVEKGGAEDVERAGVALADGIFANIECEKLCGPRM